MSITISILLPEKKLTRDVYLKFLSQCASVKGEWEIYELDPFNLNLDEVHDCVLRERENERSQSKKSLNVYVTLYRNEFSRKYGRSRRKFYWRINTETKLGRSLLDYTIQLAVPLKAFNAFKDVVVLAEGDRKAFFEPKTYTEFAKRSLIESFSEESLIEAGFIDSNGQLLLL